MRALLVEDDLIISKHVSKILKPEGFQCDITDIGSEGIEIGRFYQYDLIVLDLILPDIDGYEILKSLRNSKIKTPIIILSGICETDDKIKGLGFGADDYITKPFNKDEFLARVRAVIRRSNGHSESSIKIGKLELKTNNKIVLANNHPVHLTSKEYRILELMAIKSGHILTKEMFLNHLYNGIDEPELKIIDVFMCKLRRKITKSLGEEGYIQTIWGQGYMLKAPHENLPNSRQQTMIV